MKFLRDISSVFCRQKRRKFNFDDVRSFILKLSCAWNGCCHFDDQDMQTSVSGWRGRGSRGDRKEKGVEEKERRGRSTGHSVDAFVVAELYGNGVGTIEAGSCLHDR